MYIFHSIIMASSKPDGLLAGFVAAGGWYDEDLFALQDFPEMGMGAVALRDIPVGTSIPAVTDAWPDQSPVVSRTRYLHPLTIHFKSQRRADGGRMGAAERLVSTHPGLDVGICTRI
jgi:hypothetical protein